MTKIIGKIAATEKIPTTIDEFFFWTDKTRILHPFDVVKVDHINNSTTFGVIEEISHITDAASYLTSYISSDFGDVTHNANTHRIGMNFVKARVVGNTENIYTPVLDGHRVSLASREEVSAALGLDDIKHPLPCGYLEMYEGEDKILLPVHFNSHFVIGPEGAHLNISGISGLAAKTSYAMFLIKAIHQKYVNEIDIKPSENAAFVIFNVKGRDLVAIDESNEDLSERDKEIYEMLGMDFQPFDNVRYFYPYSNDDHPNTYAHKENVKYQIDQNKAYKYKYIYEQDKDSLELLFANIDDTTGTMDSIINYIITEQGNFGNIRNWGDFLTEVDEHCRKQSGKGTEITVTSWRKFKRIVRKALTNPLFGKRIAEDCNEVRLRESIYEIRKNDVFVVDIAKLDEDMQSFVFGDVIKAIYDLKLGQANDRDEDDIPTKIVVFVDELNKYASHDVPRSSPILRQIIDITERGRSLGIILFSAEQFKSAIHDRVKGNCSTHAYGRTNAIEISKYDYKFVPNVYKGMMTRLKQGEYIIQNPVFRSLLNIKFPNPIYKQFKHG
jgi:DNA helicase HerA-like ATPase